MDKLTLPGMALGLCGILAGMALEGGHPSILFQGAAFLIVFIGTLGAVMMQSPMRVFILAIRMGGGAFVEPKLNGHRLILQIADWSALARMEGILALEMRLPSAVDPFLKKGLQLLVDGNSAEQIREVLDLEIHKWEQLRWQSARVWEAAAGYAPTMGIIGAVLGLMHVMQNLSDPAKLGSGIAVAFVATIYGLILSNLLFLPVANKLKSIIMRQSDIYEMIVGGLTGIANGDNPRLVRLKMQSYIE